MDNLEIKVNWKLIVGVIVVSWLLSQAARAIAYVETVPDLEANLLIVLATAFWYLCVLLIGGLILYALFAGLCWLMREGNAPVSFHTKKNEQQPTSPEEKEADGLLGEIGTRLVALEKRQGDARLELTAANREASKLATLIINIMGKRETMLREASAMDALLKALMADDTAGLARAAGGIRDGVIAALVLSPNGRNVPAYKARAVDMVATRLGSLETGAGHLETLALDWMGRITVYRTRAAKLTVALDALDGVRPLAMLDTHLQLSQYHLMLSRESEPTRQLQELAAPGTATLLE